MIRNNGRLPLLAIVPRLIIRVPLPFCPVWGRTSLSKVPLCPCLALVHTSLSKGFCPLQALGRTSLSKGLFLDVEATPRDETRLVLTRCIRGSV